MSRNKGKNVRVLTEEERDLWNKVGATITPLRKRRDEPGSHVPARKPSPKADVFSPFISAPPRQDRLAPSSKQMDEKTSRRIRKGQIAIDSRIDLHGMSESRAHAALCMFLENAYRRGNRVVLVITGKGRQGEGALRRSVPFWLEQKPLREIAAAWRVAGRGHGGEGALYVRLRRYSGKAS